MAEPEMALEEWAANWFFTYAEGKLASNTVSGYRNLIFNHIIPKLGGVALTELSEKRIRTFYRRLSNAGLNDCSVWCVHLLLRRILDEARREGLISENPAWNISVKPSDEPRPNLLRSGQIKRYLEVAQELSAYPILYVGLASGLRQGELISLPWVAVDVCERRVILTKHWIELSAQAEKLIVEEHSRHPDTPEVFVDAKTGQPYTLHRLYYLHRKVLNKARLPVTGFRQLQLSARRLGL